ncbi:MAG: ATP-grasp domain-containing protein [Caulobacter sp.]|nr:ATP-grasp domain-containing protein [Caulobacter sp.]
MSERVLVTGARAAAALDIARDFARAGYEVHMADCVTARLSRWSRSVTRVHRYPSPVNDPAGFRTRLTKLIDQLAPVLVVPACEEVFHLAALPLSDRLFQPPTAMLRTLHDKALFAELCQGLGLSVPETHRLDQPADLDRFRAASRDWVFKASYSRFGEGTLVGPSPEQLDARAPLSGWIAQRRVVGREVSLYAVARAGVVTAFAAYGSDWRLEGGASLTFDPLEPALAATLLEQARALSAACGLTGQFACDLIVDAAGRPWLIECNPRATSGAHLLVGDGGLARAMLATPPTPILPGGDSLHLLPAFLTFGLAMALRQGRLGDWWRQLRKGRDVAGRPGDRLPMLGAVIDGLAFMRAGVRMGLSTTAATTVDIEWNGEALP